MSHIDREWLEERIAKKKALIDSIETAIVAVTTTGQSYQLDTGQTRQMVTRANIASLRDMVASLENEITTLNARLCGGSVVVTPGF